MAVSRRQTKVRDEPAVIDGLNSPCFRVWCRGRIAACNVLSDMYAMGVVDVDNVLMLLASSLDMPDAYREIVTAQMIKGFDEQCKLAGTIVSGGQSVRNPWPIIGGVAQSICKKDDILMPIHAVAGDIIILTKPIGTQLAVNAKQWMWDQEKWKKYAPFTTERTVRRAFHLANQQMMRLNRIGAQLMHKYHSHAATDVTGFGILGHLDALCKTQTADISMEIHTLPILAGMAALSAQAPGFRLLEGFSAETSGGLMICMPSLEAAESYIKEIFELEQQPAWIIGRVTDEPGHKARLIEGYKIIEV